MNKLSQEPSLYLRQHQNNPVNWLTLRDNPFELAKSEHKPVFISIGYSSCHWCHVMSRETFDNEQVANILNNDFISVKVDREEYPDIDKKYQFYIQLLGKNGGWPLSVFTDDDGIPFFAGTYFPPNESYGIPGFIDILNQISNFYKNDKGKLKGVKEGYFNILIEQKKIDNFETLNIKAFAEGIDKLLDMANGGLKGTTKFPNIPTIIALTKENFYHNKKTQDFLNLTASKLCTSGIFDHINGGFFRYCIDESWFVPHFEKMLYDNALNVSFLSKMYELTNNKTYLHTAEMTLDFLMDDFFTEHGFISSMNAESEDFEGNSSEGFYYKINENDLKILDESELIFISEKIYLKNNVINIQTNDYKDILKTHTILTKLNKTKKAPDKDYKIIISWNSLLVIAMLDYFGVSADDFYFNAALNLFGKLKQHFDGANLFRIRYNDTLFEHSCLEDYSYLLAATQKVFEITKDVKLKAFAKQLIEAANKLFFKDGLLYFDKNHSVFDTFDEAIYSAFGLYVINTVYFSKFIDLNVDIKTLKLIAFDRFNKFPLAHPTLLNLQNY
ncbi:DUF255 domain-containing protein [Deferribacterales bacterium Es71-Z0220]|uniref:thioredoxin domain-containing protein n=1 Tax=Deferrivibrio essentukiensis TaxID=2880922 RepID=UPI001F61B5C3|nr:DUF255 domain-containing protein [Deferrivibrio essentukiensis]MBZ4672318.1 hypothetical protein [Deferribacteraceae bacterium]MCB4205377.1 DUF255 domain-containing protein [Deferrivibrio essentukiensis]